MIPSIYVLDWVVFGILLLGSLLVGVYQACTGGKQKTSGEYLLGNRQLPFIPVTLSLLVTFISTNGIIGNAAEMYIFGVQYSLASLGYALGMFFAAYVFVPLFYPLKLISVNEYLLLRFESRVVHVVGSFLTVGAAINYSGVVLYGACAAIEAMSGFSARWAIILSGVVCTIYTTIGGMKAVIWTDVFQCVIIFVGTIYVTIIGIVHSSGIVNVWNVNKAWGRTNFFDFDPDPTKRLNFYGCIFGGMFTCMGVFGYIQAGVQRYASLPTMTQARWCLLSTIPGNILINLMSCLTGIVVFAFYTNAGCDPFKAGYIPSPNHILPYFVATEFRIPVLTGLFLSGLMASSLSTASSSLNASGANTWEDVFKYWFPNMEENRKTIWLKIIVSFYGVISILVALGITLSDGIINQIIGTVSSCLQGPAAGLFFMGAFVPWVNSKGASIGGISGFFFGLWLVIGSFYSKKQWSPLPSTIANCSSELHINSSLATAASAMLVTSPSILTTAEDNLVEDSSAETIMGIARFYNVSFMWKREVVTGFTMGVAIVISLITGLRKPSSVEARLVHPLIRRFVGPNKETSKEDLKEKQTEVNGFTQMTRF